MLHGRVVVRSASAWLCTFSATPTIMTSAVRISRRAAAKN